MTKIFYKDADAVILIYDITRRGNFEQIKEYWFKHVKEINTKVNCAFAIVGHKSDEFEREEVSEKESKEYAEKVGAFWFSASVKEGTGIEEIFKGIANKFLNQTTALKL